MTFTAGFRSESHGRSDRYKLSLMPNSRFGGLKVLPAFPNSGLFKRLLPLGPFPIFNWKLVWLRMLNASARNCSRKRSETRMFLNSDVSRFKYPGPTKVLRPRLLTQPRQGAEKKLSGRLKPSVHCSWVAPTWVAIALGRSLATPSRL